MDSKINIFCDPHLGKYHKFINNLIEELKVKKDKPNLIFENNPYEHIKILNLLNNYYCDKCDKYADYIGLCIDHFNQNDIHKYIFEFKDTLKKMNDDEKKNIFNYINTYRNHLLGTKNKLKDIIKYYNNNISKLFKYCQPKNINIINTENIDYNNLNVIFNDKISYKIITTFYNTPPIREINIIILLTFFYKKYKYELYFIDGQLFRNNLRKIFIGNNNILYNSIFNSNIIHYIDIIDAEHLIYINNHALRFDLFIILKIFSKDFEYIYYKLVIETDEKHHYINETNHDILKDKYCIDNNISLLRLHIDKNNKISQENINFCLFFIKYLIKTQKTMYYFYDKYINTNNNNNINNNIEKIKIDNNDYIISFGSNIKTNSKINNNIIKQAKNIENIKNIDYHIKNNNINSLIEKFSINNNNCEYTDNPELEELCKKYNIDINKNVINLHN
jgi:hypothetical protein